MLINLGLGLFALTLLTGALASADLAPLAHDLSAFGFVIFGLASTVVIALDVVLAFLAANREVPSAPRGSLAHHH